MATLDAVVVGSGPNGLAAAITIAAAGRSVTVIEAAERAGGCLRTDELLPGVNRDHCAAVFPFGIGSPFFESLPLAEHGLEWLVPDISFAHPLGGTRAAVAYRSLEATAEQLDIDSARYRRLVGPLAEQWEALAAEVMGPIIHWPRHPVVLARFAATGIASSQWLANRFATDEARALIAGCAAHSVVPLDRLSTAGVAKLFLASAHARGWPVVRGGAGTFAGALVSHLESLGGTVRTATRVRSISDLPPSRAVLFDTDPAQLVDIAGTGLSRRYGRRARGFRPGPGTFKVDFLLDGQAPWSAEPLAHAPTVHVGGTFEECAAAEAAVASGSHPDSPFVLVAQQGAADPTRTPAGQQLVWAYCHVPHGSTVDMTAAVEGQIERFAPGFRDLVVERWVTGPAQLEATNANLRGGDITGGANTFGQLLRRPRALRPYDTSNPAWFLCSASTPPGGGVHGMAGHRAAKRALAGPLS